MANVLFLCEKQLEKIPVVETVKAQFGAEVMYFESRNVTIFLRNHPMDYIAVCLDSMSVNSEKELLFLFDADVNASFILIGRRESCKYYYEKSSRYKRHCIFFPFTLPDFVSAFSNILQGGAGEEEKKESLEDDIPLLLPESVKPVMDGAKTLEKIRSKPQYQNIPVIFLTGVTDSSMVKDAVKLKPQGYVLKNISKLALIAKIKEVIG